VSLAWHPHCNHSVPGSVFCPARPLQPLRTRRSLLPGTLTAATRTWRCILPGTLTASTSHQKVSLAWHPHCNHSVTDGASCLAPSLLPLLLLPLLLLHVLLLLLPELLLPVCERGSSSSRPLLGVACSTRALVAVHEGRGPEGRLSALDRRTSSTPGASIIRPEGTRTSESRVNAWSTDGQRGTLPRRYTRRSTEVKPRL